MGSFTVVPKIFLNAGCTRFIRIYQRKLRRNHFLFKGMSKFVHNEMNFSILAISKTVKNTRSELSKNVMTIENLRRNPGF